MRKKIKAVLSKAKRKKTVRRKRAKRARLRHGLHVTPKERKVGQLRAIRRVEDVVGKRRGSEISAVHLCG